MTQGRDSWRGGKDCDAIPRIGTVLCCIVLHGGGAG